jgi:class 3 adenylate cyclase
VKITAKAILLLAALAAGPIAALVGLFLPRYGEAVVGAEKSLQLVVTKEVNDLVDRRIQQVYDDASTVAAAISYASASGDDAGMSAMRAVLATRKTIAVARLEIPERHISTVLGKADNDASVAPSSDEALRAACDARGVAFRSLEGSTGVLVVSVPTPSGAKGTPKAYVTVPIYTGPLQEDLEELAKVRSFDGETNIVIADASRRVVAAVGSWHLATGADVSKAPFFRIVPDGIPLEDSGVQSDYDDGGRPMAASVVTVRSLGWLVGIARPHAVAYANLVRLRKLLIGVALCTMAAALVASVLVARAVVRPVVALRRQAGRIGRREWSRLVPPSTRRDEIGELDRAMVDMASDLKAQEERIAQEVQRRTDLSRFMSQELVDKIIRGEHPLVLGGERREVSVLFADVVAFTPLAETRPAEEVVSILNELFTVLTEVVFRHGGVVDKFVGDSLMAVWGAPVAQEDHATRALSAAEDMMRFLETASEDWRRRFDCEIRLGVGVNSGEVVVGNIGSNKRMEYTVIGDVVNVAARLESIAQPNQVLVGESTVTLVGEGFELRRLGARVLTGRSAETTIFELEV